MIDTNRVRMDISQYPSEVIEDIVYIAEFTNRKCDGDINRLVGELKAIKKERSYNYFYKLFSGRWLEKGVFTAGVDKIKEIASAVRDIDSGRAVAGIIPHTKTDVVEMIENAIDGVSWRGSVCKWLLICGTTGAQKTYSATHYAATHRNAHYMEAPSTASISELATFMGEFFPECKRSYSGAKARNIILQCANENDIFIIDNAQRMYDPRRGLTQQTFSFLQTLQDRSKCTIVLIFVDEATGEDSLSRAMFGKDKGFFEQIIGRAGGKDKILYLPNHTSDRDLLAFAKSAGFKNEKLRKAMLPILRHLSRVEGRLRVALRALQEAAIYAASEQRDILIEDFIAVLPTCEMPDKIKLEIETLGRKAHACEN